MFGRNMLPPSSGLKCVGSGIGLAIWANYENGGHETEGEWVKKWTESEPMARNGQKLAL
jgi:hypothetical protein